MGSWSARQYRRAGLAAFLLLSLGLISVFAPLLAPYPRDGVDLSARYQGPSSQHWLGTDASGRDVFTRLLHGGRVSLLVGLSSAAIALLLGGALGLVAGYLGGVVDAMLTRLLEVMLSFPYFALALALTAVMPPGLGSAVFITSFLSWAPLARVIRMEVQNLIQKDFIAAASAAGLGHGTIMLRHVLPNLFSPLCVAASAAMSRGMLGEAALSYFGLGVQLPVPSWGNMMASARDLVTLGERWWLWLPPGVMVVLAVLSANTLGDGLRDSADAPPIGAWKDR